MFSKLFNRLWAIVVSVGVLALLTVGLPNTEPAGAAVGLIGRWGFEGSVSDSSGNENNGQLVGAATFGVGKNGNGLMLDGSSNTFAQVPSSPSLNSATGALTVSAWVKSTGPNGWNSIVSRQEGTGGNDQFSVMATGSQYGWYLNTVNGSNQGFFGGSLTQNTWTHLATTYDGSTVRVYINGLQVASAAKSGTLAPVSTPLIIGGNANDAVPNTAQELFTGVIDDLCVYDRALSAAEISTGTDCADSPGGTTTATATTAATTAPFGSGGVTIPANTCVQGDTAGGSVVFDDAFAPGWIQGSWNSDATISATGGVNNSAAFTASRLQWEALGGWNPNPGNGVTTVTFTAKGAGTWKVIGSENGVGKGEAPFTPTADWTTWSCRWANPIVGGPTSFAIQNTGATATLTLDNIKLNSATTTATTSVPTSSTTTTAATTSTTAAGSSTTTIPSGAGAVTIPANTCVQGDTSGGSTVFDDAFGSGWIDGSWDDAATLTPNGGVNGTAALTASRLQWKALGGWNSNPGNGVTTITFSAKGDGTWKSSAPRTVSVEVKPLSLRQRVGQHGRAGGLIRLSEGQPHLRSRTLAQPQR